MGWDFQHIEKGEKTADIIRRDLNGEFRLIDCAIKNGAAYCAVAHKDDPDTVEGLVVLIKRDSRSYYNFGMKWMDENTGPYYYDCPARILDLLSPPQTDTAKEWREKCRAKAAKVAEAKAVKHGTIIEFAEPLRFSDGIERQRFTYDSTEKCFVTEDNVMAKITRWRERAFTIVGQAA